MEGGCFLFGPGSDPTSGLDGPDCVYLYPGLERALAGAFSRGRLLSGRYGRVVGASEDPLGVMRPEVRVEVGGDVFRHDPSTWMRIR